MTREEAIDVLKHNYPSACFTDLCDAVDMAISALEHVPTINAVEVVRCKDCKYYKWLAECELLGNCMGTNGFCSWGEKLEKEEK